MFFDADLIISVTLFFQVFSNLDAIIAGSLRSTSKIKATIVLPETKLSAVRTLLRLLYAGFSYEKDNESLKGIIHTICNINIIT